MPPGEKAGAEGFFNAHKQRSLDKGGMAMRKQASGRVGKLQAAGLRVLCFACLWIIWGAMTAQAAQPDREAGGEAFAGKENTSGYDASGNGTISENDIQAGPLDPGQLLRVQNWNITAEPVSYGQPLKTSALKGNPLDAQGKEVRGSFVWKEPEKIMTTVGEVSAVVLFTPETEEKDGQIRKGKPYPVNIWVTVRKGTPGIEKWCEVEQKQVIYDGDVLGEVTRLQGGSAFYESYVDGKRTKSRKEVSGKFVWKQADQKLEAGRQSCELVFVPSDESRYERVSAQVELEVLPRPVDLRLELSETVVRTGEELRLEAFIQKTQKLQAAEGDVEFYVGDTRIETQPLTESEDGWGAQAGWVAEVEGSYPVYAKYIPKDGHTAPETSTQSTVSVVLPLSCFVTEKLAQGREGRAYQEQLLTDASGKLAVRFTLEDGALPEGLELKKDSGEISGTPKEAGEFVFTVAAREKDGKVSRQYCLLVKEKLTFFVRCSDIRYGEQLTVSVQASPKTEIRYSCTFEGREDTSYPESETPPALPGSYRVKVRVEEPEDYEGLELSQDFVIRKAVPSLTVTMDPSEPEEGKECTLAIRLEDPADPAQKEGLPEEISVSFDEDVELTQALEGKDGSYTLKLLAPRKEALCCRISVGENAFYESAEAVKDITLRKKEETKKDETQNGQKPSSGDDTGKEPEAQSEPEPVKKTPEEVEAEFWQDVIFRIYKAQEKGETVTINAKGHGSLPDKVLAALRQHEKVTLALVWEGDMIVIPAGKAPGYDKEHKTWTLAELSALYPQPKAAAQPEEQTAKETEQTLQQASAPVVSQSAPGASGGTDPEAERNKAPVPEENGSEEDTEESETKETEKQPDFTEALKESEPISAMNEVEEGSAVDWFLAAAGVCAVCGVVAVALAVAAMMKGKRRNGD